MKKRTKLSILAIVLVLGGFLIYRSFFVSKTPEYELAEVIRGDIREEISETGKVVSNQEVNLYFQDSGIISNVFVLEGDFVEENQPLLALDIKKLLIKEREAKAAVDSAWAKLYQAVAGSTAQEIKIYETARKNAQDSLSNIKTQTEEAEKAAAEAVSVQGIAYQNAQTNLDSVLASTKTDLDNLYNIAITTMRANKVAVSTAVKNMDSVLGIDNSFENDEFESFLSVRNHQALNEAKSAYNESKTAFNTLSSSLDGLTNSSDTSSIENAMTVAQNSLNIALNALEKTRTVLDNTITGGSFSVADLAAYKTTIDTDSTSITTASTNLQTAKNNIELKKKTNQTAIDTAEATLSSSEQQFENAKAEQGLTSADSSKAIVAAEGSLQSAIDTLDSKLASLRDVDKAIYLAAIDSAQASYDLITQQIEDATLKAPISGVVTNIDFDIGELALSTARAAQIISESYEIEMEVSELDISDINIESQLIVTFDALGTTEFAGMVIDIAPREIVKDDDIYYKVKARINQPDQNLIKSGMTADVSILVGEASNVLIVPEKAVSRQSGKTYVHILENDELKKVEIELGLKGVREVEVVSGLNEGDNIVLNF